MRGLLRSLWLDGHYRALKEECLLIYDVKRRLTFLLPRYCQGAMVIRQLIQLVSQACNTPRYLSTIKLRRRDNSICCALWIPEDPTLQNL